MYVKMNTSLNYGLLVKWFNTRASQARIHGFKPHTGYQIKNKTRLYLVFLIFLLYNVVCGDKYV